MSKKPKKNIVKIVYIGRTWVFGEKGFSHHYLPLETVEDFIEWSSDPKHKKAFDDGYRHYAAELFHKKDSLVFGRALGDAHAGGKVKWDTSDVICGIYTVRASEDETYSEMKWTGECVQCGEEDSEGWATEFIKLGVDPLGLSLKVHDGEQQQKNHLYRQAKKIKRSTDDAVLAALLPLRNEFTHMGSAQRNKWKLKILNYLDQGN
tara:strand:- start:1349 stop:1966 length:618 start_codon:yes stop_codon:yes gene_type:complete